MFIWKFTVKLIDIERPAIPALRVARENIANEAAMIVITFPSLELRSFFTILNKVKAAREVKQL